MFYVANLNGYSATVYEHNELTKMISDTIQYYEETQKRLIEKNRHLTEAAEQVVRKDYEEQINNLNERIRLSYGEFASQKEKEAYNQFEKRHMHNRLTSKYNGGRAPYLIPTGTGLGTILKVVCPICGESEDITDTEAW